MFGFGHHNDAGADINAIAAKPGDRMPDGTVFAGISPSSLQPMYTTPKDAFLRRSWDKAMNYAEALDAHGHHDWRVPTRSELQVLFQNRAAIGGFDRSGSLKAGSYWSSLETWSGMSKDFDEASAWAWCFSDSGKDFPQFKDTALSLRCVR